MNSKLRKVLGVLIVVVVLAGWYISVFGAGPLKTIKDSMKFGLDINGGVYVVMEADTKATGSELKALMEQTREVLNNRVNAMGISEATVVLEGKKRLRIEMPGVKDAEQAIEQIGKTAQLRFVLADGSTVLTGENVKDASIDTDNEHGGYKINLKFDSTGAKLFEEATKKAMEGNVTSAIDGMSPNQIAIILDDKVVTNPQVQNVISNGSCEITSSKGGYSKEEASTTAALIRGGALPLSLNEVTSSVQTATIGENALNKSVIAGLIGLAGVFLLMILMYKLLGLVANIALLLYVLIDIWAMAAIGGVLTLPGIAGIILSIGMAVDANVIIFSRIKEEISHGKSIRVAVDQGFKHALTTVLDAQITTLIATIVLYEIGSTTVKGFALTLMLGIIASIFTAVVITQIFVGIIAESKTFSKNKHFGVDEEGNPRKLIHKQFKFIENRKVFFAISAIVIVVGIGFAALRGFNYGIDFTGGTMMEFDMGKKVETAQIEKAIEKYKLNPTVIFSGTKETHVQIKTIKALDHKERGEIIDSVKEAFGLDDKAVLASEEFGPTIGRELKTNAVKSVVIAAIGMLIYIIFRFKSWKFGVSSIAGVLHDVLVVLAFYAIFGITINNPFIAGILTVVGYSINDTIVIFDRIRENKHLYRKESIINTLNISINQTLDRSVMTSLTTIVCMIPLFFMVSSSIREFVLPLMVGVLVGTYSSIFLCSPLLYEFTKKDEMSKYMTKANLAKGQKKNTK
ncbi:MAG: protein translocase subunit SecD [Peptostreptococcaceae bacterium]|nr:protein translocase subunit SecD [Peptostreptococcaceae bacterium]MDY5738986.1 protein translocase subunit SecD [Anaerovoracaceae bacterium]SFE08808.1 SecD/SecF fusion protein [Peptostreptococcaceae bacterium pGA-8]